MRTFLTLAILTTMQHYGIIKTEPKPIGFWPAAFAIWMLVLIMSADIHDAFPSRRK